MSTSNLVYQNVEAVQQLTITLANLASSTTGAGRQSTLVANSSISGASKTTDAKRRALISYQLTMGTTPSANTPISFFLIRSDGTHADDGAGASDAAFQQYNANCVYVANCPNATTNQKIYGTFVVEDLGALWGIAVVQGTGVNLENTAGDQYIGYQYLDDDIQAAA
jgi:hypothetical protein